MGYPSVVAPCTGPLKNTAASEPHLGCAQARESSKTVRNDQAFIGTLVAVSVAVQQMEYCLG
jgi:hypothetical protein